MLYKRILIPTMVSLITFCLIVNCMATDFDDGIPFDENISDTISRPAKNTKFIVLKAKSKARVKADNRNYTKNYDGKNGAMNSVVMGPGSDVNGDIIIIDESRGDNTLVVD